MTSPQPQSTEVALYYPGHLWYHLDWVKTLLLFFDGIALLVPEYKKGEPEMVDPDVAGSLRDKGLLHYLMADKVVDKDATKQLSKGLGDFIASGALDPLAKGKETAFHEISMSRMGYMGDRNLAEEMFDELKKRGLAKDTKDGVSVPLHPAVRYLILVMLAQILRPQGASLGYELSPATDRFEIVRALTEMLNLPSAPSAGHVVAFDLQTVAVNLSTVPLDEVLSFREEHLGEHRRYVRDVRKFVRELSLLPEKDRIAAFEDRQKELDDRASDLKRKARKAWRQPASFGFGIAGATWRAAAGDPIGAFLAIGALLLGQRRTSTEVDAFSYLFAAHQNYG